METTICLSKTVLTPNPLSLSTQYSNNPLFPSFKYSNNPLFPSFKYPTPTHPNHTTIIRSAISRTKKEETVETVKTHLQNCHLFAAINYKGFSVKHFQQLRNTLPSNTKLIVAKNRLVLRAIDNTKWEAMKPCLKGMNAWLFVHTEEIPLALKPYRTFLKENKLDHNDFTGGCFDGKFYGPNDIKSLETLPSRNEVYANLLGSLKTPSTALVGTLQAPARDLVLVLMAYVKKLEDEQGEFFEWSNFVKIGDKHFPCSPQLIERQRPLFAISGQSQLCQHNLVFHILTMLSARPAFDACVS